MRMNCSTEEIFSPRTVLLIACSHAMEIGSCNGITSASTVSDR